MSIQTDVAVTYLQTRVDTLEAKVLKLENDYRELHGVLQAYVNELRTKVPQTPLPSALPGTTLKRATR